MCVPWSNETERAEWYKDRCELYLKWLETAEKKIVELEKENIFFDVRKEQKK